MKKILIALALASSAFSFQKKSTWKILFDGKDMKQWHTWNKDKVTGWSIENGTLHTNGNVGDLTTNTEFGDFVLEFEFNISPKGNSGIIYKSIEKPGDNAYTQPYLSGPEFQIIDDKNYPNPVSDGQKTAANYEINVPTDLSIVKPAGQWNSGKVEIKNNRIRHYLNGKKVVEYTYGGKEWKQEVSKSKFANWTYATPHHKGHIVLQDHGNPVSYRNIRIKEI